MKDIFNYIFYGGFFIIFIGIATMGYVARQNNVAFINTSEQIESTNKILGETGILDALDDENETDVRNYLLTNNSALLEPSTNSEKAMLKHLDRFKLLVKGNSLQRLNTDSLEWNINQKFKIFDSVIALQKNGHGGEAMRLFTSANSQSLIEKTGQIISGIEESQRSYLGKEKEVGAKTISGINRIFWLLLVIPVLLLGTSVYAVRHALATRKKKEKEISRLNAGLEQRIIERTEELRLLNASLEKRVAERTLELQETNNELESFSYTVSHDLRAPLHVIIGFSKILSHEYANKIDAAGLECLNMINTDAKKMMQLMDDLLHFSKSGKAILAPLPVHMTDLVKVVIAEVQSGGTNGKVRIHLNDLNFAVCDTTLIKQVWVNLISNAIKYSRNAEKPVIEIGMTGANGSKTYYIKDNGAGFDMKFYNKLFAVFQRLHTGFEGTGVGLAFVQRIISKHGGKIWAESRVNEGATFYFTLP